MPEFSLMELSPSLEPLTAVTLSLTADAVSIRRVLETGWKRLDTMQLVTLIDIGHILGDTAASLLPAIQLNTSNGVILLLCTDMEQKRSIARYFTSIARFLQVTASHSISHPQQSATLFPHIDSLRSFNALHRKCRDKLAMLDSFLCDNANAIHRMNEQLALLESKQMAFAALIGDSQAKSMDVLDRTRKMERIAMMSSERLSVIKAKLDDKALVLEDKRDTLEMLQSRLLNRQSGSKRVASCLIYLVVIPSALLVLSHYMPFLAL